MANYTSVQPPAHNDTYVKSTTKYNTSYWPYYATDPALSLTGSGNSWLSASGATANQRINVDLGSAKIARRLYYENFHGNGADVNAGSKIFYIQGSNSADSFAELAYDTNTGWTTLAVTGFSIVGSDPVLDAHVALNQADPKYGLITNVTAYRYYSLKIASNWGHAFGVGIRRFAFQTEDGFTGRKGRMLFF